MERAVIRQAGGRRGSCRRCVHAASLVPQGGIGNSSNSAATLTPQALGRGWAKRKGSVTLQALQLLGCCLLVMVRGTVLLGCQREKAKGMPPPKQGCLPLPPSFRRRHRRRCCRRPPRLL